MDHILFLFFLFLINKYSLKKKEREGTTYAHKMCTTRAPILQREREIINESKEKSSDALTHSKRVC